MCRHQEMEWLLLCICQLCRPSSWGFESCTIVSLPLGERPICRGRSFDLRIQTHEKKCRISSHHWLWNSRKASKTQFLSQLLINLFNTPSFPVRFLLHSHIQGFPQGPLQSVTLDVFGINSVNLGYLVYVYFWPSVYTCNNAVEQPLQRVVGGPSSLWAVILSSAPAHLRLKGEKCSQASCTHPGKCSTKVTTEPPCFVHSFIFSSHLPRAPAGSAAAMRCQSWWWATSGICSDSASCPAGQCRSSWRRRGNVATWSALQNSTGTSCCSSKSCWASPWHGACARTTPPSACRGLYRGTAAPSCDPESSLHFAHLRSGEKGLLILMTGNIPCGLLLYWADFS